MKKIIAILCLLLAVMMLVCSCDTGNDETESTTTAATTTEAPGGSTPTTPAQTTTNNPGNVETPTTPTYKVTVVDETGAPVSGATVQLCVGDLCKLPGFTGADGVVTFNFEKADYTVKVTVSGYTSNPNGYTFSADSTEMTVTLTKAA